MSEAVDGGAVRNLRELFAPKEHDHGGLGTILAHRVYARRSGRRGAEFVDLAVLPPGTSIGRHRHGADRETYVVLDGSGLMFRDGEDFRVGAGDVIANRPFGEHGLVNDGPGDLRLLVFEEPEAAGPHTSAAASGEATA
ncbi:cupin domain-containing protein [Streptomyces coelicoflavus]|jgi:mannose-6-phosphate isomerase-like protein (cupin superfamily)|uniref:cupin domain-containing protein n=1 Tax=Streptomyces TaxID=1883 RepID=UPI000B412D28|nr:MULTISPECIES: cupin domain-containing protein [Streptomyces]OWA21188.1 ScatJ protein [Streptomyces sp. CS159]